MKAGDPLEWKSDIPKWRAVIEYITDFADISMWSLGRWVNEGWDQPLPDVLVIDAEFIKNYKGLPFLYEWRISTLDLASLGSAAALREGGLQLLRRAVLVLRDLGVSWGGNWVISQSSLGVKREDDEVVTPYARAHKLFYLSLSRIKACGYTSYAIDGDKYVFYR